MTSPNSLFEIINAVIPDPNILFWLPPSVPDSVAVNPNATRTLLANGWRNPDCPISEN